MVDSMVLHTGGYRKLHLEGDQMTAPARPVDVVGSTGWRGGLAARRRCNLGSLVFQRLPCRPTTYLGT